MRRRGWGRIINTASAHSLIASPNKSAYVAAKHGVAGFTKTVALEAARDNVTVNCISPGYVWTPLVENQIPDTMKARGFPRTSDKRRPSGRAADQTFRHAGRSRKPGRFNLCSDGAQSITGANLAWTAVGLRLSCPARCRPLACNGPAAATLARCGTFLLLRPAPHLPAAPPLAHPHEIVSRESGNWRVARDEHDRERLRDWRKSFTEGLTKARAGVIRPTSSARAHCSIPMRRLARSQSPTANIPAA